MFVSAHFAGAKAGIAAAAVLCVVGLALDITSIVYTSRQIHVHRRNRQAALTNSNTDKGKHNQLIS